jgi:hypothetical protein
MGPGPGGGGSMPDPDIGPCGVLGGVPSVGEGPLPAALPKSGGSVIPRGYRNGGGWE